MPPRAKARRTEVTTTAADAEEEVPRVMCQFLDEKDTPTGAQVLLPVSASVKQLEAAVRALLGKGGDEDDEEELAPLSFFLDGNEIRDTVAAELLRVQREATRERLLQEGRRFRPQDIEAIELEVPAEAVLKIAFRPQAVFRVRAVCRSAATLDGHAEAVLCVAFSPDGTVLATGGGDKEIRLWDMWTNTPVQTLTRHRHWVQALAWSPDGLRLASGSRDGGLCVWRQKGRQWHESAKKGLAKAAQKGTEAKTGKKTDGEEEDKMDGDAVGTDEYEGISLKGHSNYLSHIAWEPAHKNPLCERFVTASKDQSLKVWNGATGAHLFDLNGHKQCVTCVKWGGLGFIYSSSQDTTVMVWNATNGLCVQVLQGHGHWVNALALSTDAVLRTGWHDHEKRAFTSRQVAAAYAAKRFDAVVKDHGGLELLASCSDDNTMFLWKPNPSENGVAAKPLARMTGHQGAIFAAAFSPDGRYLASSSADKSVKLWHAATGKFYTTFRGHVAAVYHITWSADSRLLVSGSRDTTLKLWSVSEKDLVEDLPGHSDEVFATDWSPDGRCVATGSKDKTVKIWVH